MRSDAVLPHRRSALVFVMLCALPLSQGAAQTGPDKRLIQKTTIAADEVPLRKLLQQLCDKHKLKLEIDSKGLADEGIADSLPVTIHVDGVTLGSALNLFLPNQGLSHHVDKGTLYIQTQGKADETLLTRTYPLSGLGLAAGDLEAFQYLLHDVGTSSAPWMEDEGVGGSVVNITPQSMTIEQSRLGHDEIADLLQRLAAALAGKRRPPTPIERAEDLIRKGLAKPATFPAGEMTLPELTKVLQANYKLNVWIDTTALADEGIDAEGVKLNFSGQKQALGAALLEAFKSARLAWLVRDELLQITTTALTNEYMVTRVYDVRRQNRPTAELAAQLENQADLGPWEDADGVGGCTTVLGPLLLVRQTVATHDKIAILLGPGQ
ncbi:MAG: hypothetical protein SFV23_17100 [Planctomycetaceae bacterium]|nr:hypothetical protein [Planctomycetaceae bacterium]